MSKRTNYARAPRDLYRTIDARALPPLLRHVKAGTTFIEPCAGKGDLIKGLEAAGLHCAFASDIEPLTGGAFRLDALVCRFSSVKADLLITNPPWSRDFLHEFIRLHVKDRPMWLLFDAGWAYTRQASEFERWLTDIVAVGRLRWFDPAVPREDGKKHTDPMDDCAWYRFADDKWGATRFWTK